MVTRPVGGRRATGGRWSLSLHDVGRTAWIAALIVGAVVTASRMVTISKPPDEISDEFLYARSVADYLNGKTPAEWTHPPLSKELMAASMRALSPVGVHERRLAEPPPAMSALRGSTLVSAQRADNGGWVSTAAVSRDCAVSTAARVRVPVDPTAVAAGPREDVVGGAAVSGGGMLVGVGGGRIAWRADVPDVPARVAQLGTEIFWVGRTGTLWRYGNGAATPVEEGAFDVYAVPRDKGVWATFPARGRMILFDAAGRIQRSLHIRGHPGALSVTVNLEQGRPHTFAVVALDRASRRIWSVDPARLTYIVPSHTTEADRRAEAVSPGRGGYVWTATGRSVEVAEALGLSVVHHLRLRSDVTALLGDGTGRGVVALTRSGIACIDWRPMLGLRAPSALMSGLAAAFVLLIAMRLSGTAAAAILAAAFAALDGFSYTLGRLASPDYAVVAFVLVSWFCLLSALHAGNTRRDARLARLWLVATGVAAGLATAAKWNGAWALGGLLLVVLWDIRAHGHDGLAGAFGRTRGALLLPVVVVGAFVGIGYGAVWFVHAIAIGAPPADVLRAHLRMYRYHAYEARGFVPAESYWYQWPAGAKPILLHTELYAKRRAEIWIIMNPVVGYAGALALLALLWRGIRNKSMTLVLLPIAAAFEFLPWIYVARIPFLYQYALVTPFLAVALAWWPQRLRTAPRRAWVAAILLVAAVAGFSLLLPLIGDWRVSPAYSRTVQHALPWMFNPPRLPLVG